MSSAPRPPQELPLAILVMMSGMVVQQELTAALAKSGMRPRHCQLLMHLAEGGSTGQQDLLEALDLDPSVLVGLLNDLEKDGWVQRRRDPADRRRHIVELSGSGRAQVADLTATVAEIEDAVFTDVTAVDRELLRKALQSAWANGRPERVGAPAG